MSRSIHVAKVLRKCIVRSRELLREHLRVEAIFFGFINRQPSNINLSDIGHRSYFRLLAREYCTFKHKFHLMLLAFLFPELMLPGTIFADKPQFSHYYLNAYFFLAFSEQRFIQCFPVPLSASWKNVPFSFTVKVLKGEQLVVKHDNGLGGISSGFLHVVRSPFLVWPNIYLLTCTNWTP